LKNIQHLNCDI